MNNAWGMIKKNWLIHLAMILLCAIVTFVGSTWLGALLGILVFGTFLVLQFGDGCDRGERACSTSAYVEKELSEGRQVDEKMRAQTYSIKEATKAFLISAAPFALLAIANLIFANPAKVTENTLGFIARILFLPMAGFIRLFTGLVQVNYDGAQAAASAIFGGISRAGVDIQAIAKSLASIDNYAYAVESTLKYLTYMRIVFILGSFMLPGAMLWGYTRGPKLREKKLKDMKIGTRRKKKKLKVFGGPKKPRHMKPEV